MGLILRRGRQCRATTGACDVLSGASPHRWGCVALLAIAFTAVARAEDAVSKHDFQAKFDYCKSCHGASGEVFAAIIRYRGSPDNKLSISKTSYRRFQSTGERTTSCLTWLTF